MKFKTAYDKSDFQGSPVGSRFRKQYVSDGTDIKECGVEDVYDSIQKAANGRLVEDLLRRASSGDPSAIPPVVDSYTDLSKAPSDILEAHQMLKDSRASFDRLPADVKSKFNNSFDTFLKASLDGSAVSILTSTPAVEAPSNVAASLSSDELSKIRSIINGGNNNA